MWLFPIFVVDFFFFEPKKTKTKKREKRTRSPKTLKRHPLFERTRQKRKEKEKKELFPSSL